VALLDGDIGLGQVAVRRLDGPRLALGLARHLGEEAFAGRLDAAPAGGQVAAVGLARGVAGGGLGRLGGVAGRAAGVAGRALERVGAALLADLVELPLVDGVFAVVLDPDLPASRRRHAAEAAVVMDVPPVLARRAVPLVQAATPIDVLGAEAVDVVHV